MSNLSDNMKADALEAQKFSRKYLVVELDFTESSIQELEGQCDQVEYAIRGGKSPENLDMLTRIWGAYVGESLRRATGAQWVEQTTSGASHVVLGREDRHVDPLAAVRQRLTGSGNLLDFFRQAKSRLQG